MAQRFSDWYYAVSASRLGDRDSRGPLERSCRRFQEGIVNLHDPKELTAWAHKILQEEIQAAGKRSAGGDQPNALTGSRSPTELLKQAAGALDPTQLNLLLHTYHSSYAIESLMKEANDAGGYPLAVLQARYALKRALRDEHAVSLGVVPDTPKLDLAPLPLYEAGRMTNANEEAAFERWMLTDLDLCKDLAEFAAFALALRGGALEGASRAAPEPQEPAPVPKPVLDRRAVSARVEPQAQPGKGPPVALIGAGVVVLVLIVGVLMSVL